jgi:hypothetical protein
MTTENAQPQPRVRYRININRLAKGQLSFDCTVELEGPVELIGADHDFPSRIALGKLQEAALGESDRLVAALQAKYPMGVE